MQTDQLLGTRISRYFCQYRTNTTFSAYVVFAILVCGLSILSDRQKRNRIVPCSESTTIEVDKQSTLGKEGPPEGSQTPPTHKAPLSPEPTVEIYLSTAVLSIEGMAEDIILCPSLSIRQAKNLILGQCSKRKNIQLNLNRGKLRMVTALMTGSYHYAWFMHMPFMQIKKIRLVVLLGEQRSRRDENEHTGPSI